MMHRSAIERRSLHGAIAALAWMDVRREAVGRLAPTATALAILALVAGGHGAWAASPVVLEVDGAPMTLDELRADYELRRAPARFDAADLETKRRFLETTGENLLLMQIARESLGGLDLGGVQKLKMAREMRLLMVLDDHVAAAIDPDSLEAKRITRDRLNREVRLLRFIGATDSIAGLARDQVIRGRPFEEVARVYMSDMPGRQQDPELGWMSAAQLGAELTEELLLRDRQPGFVTEVRRSRRGHEFLRIKEFRPFDPASHPGAEAQLMAIVQRIRRGDLLEAYQDSLMEAHRLVVDSAAASALQKALAAYWDSLAANISTPSHAVASPHPPVWRLDAGTKARFLLRVDGRAQSVEEFVRGLSRVPFDMWPSASKLDLFQQQIESRILIDFRLAEARRLGLDRSADYAAGARRDEERILRDGLRRKLADEIPVSPREIRDHYELNKGLHYRDQNGYIPLEKVEDAVRVEVLNAKVEERLRSLLVAARAAGRLTLYPDRL